jgi:hypothetical protein
MPIYKQNVLYDIIYVQCKNGCKLPAHKSLEAKHLDLYLGAALVLFVKI